MIFHKHAKLMVGILAALSCLAATSAGPALAAVCSSNNPDEIPPFLTTGIDPNMLMIIDNSASMYDLAYVDEAGYCYDETFSTAQSYAGYFEPDGWYRYDFGSGHFEAAADESGCDEANYRQGLEGARQICLKISSSLDAEGEVVLALDAFAARGNYLNWAAASKMDIEKNILTGGKYDGDALLMEARGCLNRRFVKQTVISPAGNDGAATHRLAVAIRPPSPTEQLIDPNDRTTRIEIFPVTDAANAYDHEACQNAVEELNKESPNLGQLKVYIDDCMGYDPKGSSDPEVASQAALNHAIQTCWFIVKQGDPNSITVGDINRVINSCETIYQGNGPPGVEPDTISTDHSGYVCYGDYDAKLNVNPTSVSGYVGYCWDPGVVTWKANGKINKSGWLPNQDADGVEYDDDKECVRAGLARYCGIIDVPEIIDPSDQVTGVGDETGEFWNLPAVLVDAGVVGQVGDPVAILKGRLAQEATPTGLLQEFARDLRIGAMIFNRDGAKSECDQSDPYVTYQCADSDIRDGGRVIASLGKGEAHTQTLVDAINDIVADTWTPLAETMYHAIGYYAQDDDFQLHPDRGDFSTDETPVIAWCQMNNILLITDGAPTADQNPDMIAFAIAQNYGLGSGLCNALHGSTYLDDLSKYAYEDIWRNKIFPEDEEWQTVTTHVVAVGKFRDAGADKCSPDVLLDAAATSGGTTLYQAESLSQLESSLREAFSNIRAGAASGSAASVISATRSGEGAVYQAIFWPDKSDLDGNAITWAGEVQALFVDAQGRLFEDTNGNRQLDADDLQVTIFHDPVLGFSRACYGIIDENEECTGAVKEIHEVNYLWAANDWLSGLDDVGTLENRADGQFTTDTSRRYIFTWNDLDGSGVVNRDAEILPFEAHSAAWWSNINAIAGRSVHQDLGVETVGEAQEIINWLRGLDQAGLRSRKILMEGAGLRTWRLGDVVHSTPTVVSRPAEGYHFLYRDGSYARFVNRYNHRRHMVYFGGNDGMLHAANGGFFSVHYKQFCLTPTCEDEAGALPLGTEMWAYVPYNLWPHLKCLADPDYGHKYYVDLVPRIFDVRIFEEEEVCATDLFDAGCIHPNGWGTILVGGMRFGGEKVTVNGRDFSSAYFILDITNPEQPPVLLGEMTFPAGTAEMGYTTVIPTMVPMVTAEGSEWHLVLGSGPTNLKGESDQTGRVAVISLRELVDSDDPAPFRIPSGPPTAGNQFGSFSLTGHANSFVSDLITVDFNLNFLANAVYFGTVSGGFAADEDGGWEGGGRLYRLVTDLREVDGGQVASQPSQWADLLQESGLANPLPLIDVEQPITAAPAAAWDGNNYWIYFGSGRLFNRQDFKDTGTYSYYGIKEPRVGNSFSWQPVEFKDATAVTINTTPGQQGLLPVDQIEVLSNRFAAAAPLECLDETDSCLPADVTYFQQLRDYIAGYGGQTGTDGWYRNFHDAGERNLGQATVLGGLLTFSSYLPSDDLCQPEGYSDLYAVYYQTGTAWHRPVFSRFTEPGGVPVEYRRRIGPGLAVTPSLHVGTDTGAKAFLQTSTGAIVGIEQPELPHSDYKTGRESWREIFREIFQD